MFKKSVSFDTIIQCVFEFVNGFYKKMAEFLVAFYLHKYFTKKFIKYSKTIEIYETV